MRLHLATALGRGPTELAAFDDALLQVGAANFNLVRLSSVIPPESEVVVCDGAMPAPVGAWGDRLYVVYAEQRASRPGDEAWAGVGWVQDDDGRGLFVEHEGCDRRAVEADIDASLAHLQRGRGLVLGDVRRLMVGGAVTDSPICALVLCSYQAESWAGASERGSDLRALSGAP